MRQLFVSLDHFYTKGQMDGSLFSSSLKLCYSKLFLPFKEILFETINWIIECDRNKEVVDRIKIKNFFKVFESVNLDSQYY